MIDPAMPIQILIADLIAEGALATSELVALIQAAISDGDDRRALALDTILQHVENMIGVASSLRMP
jgi:hypothetical protein